MINNAIRALATELNAYLNEKFEINEEKIVVSSLIDQEGMFPLSIANKIVLTVVNIAPDFKAQLGRSSIGYYADKTATDPSNNSPLNYDVDILISASFSNHSEALTILSTAVQFFYRKPFFDTTNSPEIAPEIEKISVEVVNLTYAEKQNLWSTLGARYLPSVLFRTKLVAKA